jgi:hypothetical protein
VAAAPSKHLAGSDPVNGRLPRVVGARRIPVKRAQPAQTALLPLDLSPVVGQLVPGDPDQPRDRWIGRAGPADRLHGGEKRLGREVLGQGGVAAPGKQVAVDVRQRVVIQLKQPERRVGPHLWVRHALIVARAPETPTGRPATFSTWLGSSGLKIHKSGAIANHVAVSPPTSPIRSTCSKTAAGSRLKLVSLADIYEVGT